jgi:hypothetical protein
VLLINSTFIVITQFNFQLINATQLRLIQLYLILKLQEQVMVGMNQPQTLLRNLIQLSAL